VCTQRSRSFEWVGWLWDRLYIASARVRSEQWVRAGHSFCLVRGLLLLPAVVSDGSVVRSAHAGGGGFCFFVYFCMAWRGMVYVRAIKWLERAAPSLSLSYPLHPSLYMCCDCYTVGNCFAADFHDDDGWPDFFWLCMLGVLYDPSSVFESFWDRRTDGQTDRPTAFKRSVRLGIPDTMRGEHMPSIHNKMFAFQFICMVGP